MRTFEQLVGILTISMYGKPSVRKNLQYFFQSQSQYRDIENDSIRMDIRYSNYEFYGFIHIVYTDTKDLCKIK